VVGTLGVFSTAAVAVPVPAFAAAPGRIGDRVAAVVNDDVITLSEVYDLGTDYIEDSVTKGGEAMRHPAEHAVLERLIERRLVEQQIATLKLEVTDQDLDKAIDDLARRNGLDREGVKAELERQGMAWDVYRGELREQLRDMKFQQAVLRPRVTITDDELRDAFLRTGGSLGTEQATVQGVVIAVAKEGGEASVAAALARAKEAQVKIEGGTPFAEVATAYDDGPTRDAGGEMGLFDRGQLVPALDTPVFAAEIGKSFLVQTPTAIFVLRVTGKTKSEAGLDAVREKLTEQIFETRMEQEKERWYQQARRAAVVRVLLPGGDGKGPSPEG